MQLIKKHLLLIPVLLAAELGAAAQAAAQAAAENTGAAAAAEPGQNKAAPVDNFEYLMENRSDPFYPFVKKEDKKKQDDERIVEETGAVLEPMQLIEPGQLKLAAVLHVDGRYIAMAEKATGEGAILREGMLIGRRGRIMRIGGDGKVLIQETYKTTSGKEKTTEIVMNMKKEGEN